MPQDVYLGGVKKGAPTSSTEIRILLCYLIAALAPLTRQALENALLGEELVNYFELISGLDDLVKQGLAEQQDEEYRITDKGRIVAESLSSDLPRSVRESAARAVVRAQSWLRKEAQHQAEIVQQDGFYEVHCHIAEQGQEVFGLTFALPDSLTAELVKKQFIARGGEIYAQMLQSLTRPLEDEGP